MANFNIRDEMKQLKKLLNILIKYVEWCQTSKQSYIHTMGRIAIGWFREQFSDKQGANWLKSRTVMGMLKQV